MAKSKAKGMNAWEQRQESCRKAVTQARKKLDEYSGDDAKERAARAVMVRRGHGKSCSNNNAARRAYG